MSEQPKPFPSVGPGGERPALTPNGVARHEGQRPEERFQLTRDPQRRYPNGQYAGKGWAGNRTGE